MDPSSIESADREFVRKLHKLRSNLAGRQQTYEKRAWLRLWYRPSFVLIALLVVAITGFAMLNKQQHASSTVAGHTAGGEDPTPTVNASAGGPLDPTRPVRDDRPVEPAPFVSHWTIPAIKNPQPPPDLVAQAHPADEATANPAPTTVAAATSQSAEPADFKLVSVAVCQEVRHRQPLNEKNDFDLTDQHRAYVWMEVRSEGQPFVIKHVYYLNGHKYCEVPLDVRAPRMRTWSYVTLNSAEQTGSWRVEIVRDERVLKKVGFRVSDGRSAGE
jgi:hypothetical protein